MSKAIAINLMESKINRIIDIIHSLKEEGMVTGTPTNNISSGNIAKYDPVMGFTRRKVPTIIGKGKFPGSRTRWKNTNIHN
jgi:hypothetical protein